MRKTRVGMMLGCCFLALTVLAWAQMHRKAGLWEVTSSMTWQQSPMPPGMQAPPGSPFSGAPHTNLVCVTQAQIDQYGGPPPQTHGNCQVTGFQMRPDGMNAAIACTGQVAGDGTVEGSWSDPDHARVKVHFTGTMTMGQNSRPIEWTMDMHSMFKSSDCGNIRPAGGTGY